MIKDLDNILIKFQEFQLGMNLLKSSFENACESTQAFSKLAQMFIDSEYNKPIEEQPELVGYLNTVIGFNGFKKCEIGTEVYSYKDRYFINIMRLNETIPNRITYYKETLKPCINFIENENG